MPVIEVLYEDKQCKIINFSRGIAEWLEHLKWGGFRFKHLQTLFDMVSLPRMNFAMYLKGILQWFRIQ